MKILDRIRQTIDPYDPEKLSPQSGIEPFLIQESEIKHKASRYFSLALVVFLAWALIAPLDAGVHVTGSVVVQGNRKAVQHPQGGVVQEIFVAEGSVVRKGDTLVRINPLSAQAAFNSAELEYVNALSTESRLFSERELAESITWLSPMGLELDPQKVSEVRKLQERLFESRQSELRNKLEILEEQIDSFENQIAELGEVLEIRKHQLRLLSEEADNNATLAAEGYVPRSRANELERSRSDHLASIATTASEISKIRSNITSTRLQISQERSTYFKEVDEQLRDAQQTRKSSRADLESLRFQYSLTDLKAPVSGIVVGMNVFTVGGVISTGEVLMEIVPEEEGLVIEAKIPTNLIDKVHVGLEADVRFTAFSLTTTPVIPGRLMLVGADKLSSNAAAGTTAPAEYYLAKIETTDEGIQLLGDREIQAGMPVDVIIKTGERTFMNYVLKPISDRFAIAFSGE